MLAMFYARENLTLRGPVAFEFIRDDHPRHVRESFEQLPEELLRRLLVPTALHEDVEHVAVLVDGPPEIMALTIGGRTGSAARRHG
jgi:hypothetical protein